MMPTTGELGRAFGFVGEVASMRGRGRVPVTYFVDVDRDEIGRRTAAGIGPIVDRGVINALWEIPAGLEVPREALPEWVTSRLADLDAAHGGAVVRRDVRPPVRLRGAVALGKNLRRLLDALGPLSATCPTGAVVTRGLAGPDDPALLDAQLYGVGVGVADAQGVRVVSPAQTMRADVGAYQWHLAELVFAELSRAG